MSSAGAMRWTRAVRFVHRAYARRRCAFYVETDKGFDRDTVRSYLRFFARVAGGAVTAEEAIAHFGAQRRGENARQEALARACARS